MSRSFLLIGVVAVVWAIGITLADKTPSQGEQDSKLLTLYENNHVVYACTIYKITRY